MAEIGAAVVGTGFIGPVHVEALRRLAIPVIGILGSSPASSRQAAETLRLPRAYSSYAELLADERVTVVHITTPNRLHFPMARDALQAGKHVLCEKPLAMNSRESAELVALAQSAGLAAAVNYNVRYYPLCIEARERVRRGELGELFSVCGSYVQDWLLYPTDYNWRVLPESGGELRAVADIGTHWLDLLQSITGQEVTALCADLQVVHPIRQRPQGEVATFTGKTEPVRATESLAITTEDQGSILLHFRGGARGSLWVSQVTAGRKNCLRFEIAGARQALAWESERPNELWIGHRERANEALLRDPALLADASRPYASLPGGHNEGFADTLKQCFRAFYASIERGELTAPPPYPTFADGHREIVLCEAILQSHRERRWVAVNGEIS